MNERKEELKRILADGEDTNREILLRMENAPLFDVVNRAEQLQKLHKIFRLPMFNVNITYWYKIGEDNRN